MGALSLEAAGPGNLANTSAPKAPAVSSFTYLLSGEGRALSIIVEFGSEVPPIYLLDVDLPNNTRVLFEIETGQARFSAPFRKTLTEARISDGRLLLPRLVPGERPFDESTLSVRSRGKKLVENIRVAIVHQGWVGQLATTPSIKDTALLFKEESYAIVDEGLVDWSRWQEDYLVHPLVAPGTHNHSPQQLEPFVDYFDPSQTDPDWCPGACIRIPFGPGRVTWETGSPKNFGWSVLLEGFNGQNPSAYLVWGKAPSQAIDAMYNVYWGCGTALKVPDSCTAKASDPNLGVECCCNHAAAYFGHVCRFVNPGQGGEYNWPPCPLGVAP
jgi:hypothetical protein